MFEVGWFYSAKYWLFLFRIDAISVMKERSQGTEHNRAERNGQIAGNREINEYVHFDD